MSRETRIWLFVLGALFIIFGISEVRAQDASPPAPVPPAAQASEPANADVPNPPQNAQVAPATNNNSAPQGIAELSKQNDALIESCKKVTEAMRVDRKRKDELYNPRDVLCDLCDRLENGRVVYRTRYAFWRECVGDVSTGDRAKLDVFAVALDDAAEKFIESIKESTRLLDDKFRGARSWIDDPTADHFWGWNSDHFQDFPSLPEDNFGEMQGIDAVAVRHFQSFRQELLDAQTLYTMKASEVLSFVNAELERVIAELQLPSVQVQAKKEEATAPASFPPAKEGEASPK